jgi:hypothetical protein
VGWSLSLPVFSVGISSSVGSLFVFALGSFLCGCGEIFHSHNGRWAEIGTNCLHQCGLCLSSEVVS